jgi:hypothetical protein
MLAAQHGRVLALVFDMPTAGGEDMTSTNHITFTAQPFDDW